MRFNPGRRTALRHRALVRVGLKLGTIVPDHLIKMRSCSSWTVWSSLQHHRIYLHFRGWFGSSSNFRTAYRRGEYSGVGENIPPWR